MESIDPDSMEVKRLFPREVRREAQVHVELGYGVNWLSVPLEPIEHHLVRFLGTGRAALFTTGARLGPVLWGTLLPRTMSVLVPTGGPKADEPRRYRVDRHWWPIDLAAIARDFDTSAFRRLVSWGEGPPLSILELDLFEAWALRRMPGLRSGDTLEVAWLRQAARQKIVPPPEDLDSVVHRLLSCGAKGNEPVDSERPRGLDFDGQVLAN